MEYILKKKIEKPTIIEGFPGFGLVGTITTEYLIDQLEAKPVGSIQTEKVPPMVAVHESRTIPPIGLFYAEKHNILIIHVMTNVVGLEWDIANTIKKLANEIKAEEIISIEGVASPQQGDQPKTFYFSNQKEIESLEPLTEGIIMGTTGVLMLEEDLNITCLFAETASGLPDSNAASEIIKALDKHLNLKVDPKPLKEQAKEFEKKIQSLLKKSEQMTEEQKKKRLDYMG